MDGKVQTVRSVKCTPDAFMALAPSHGNVIVLRAGVEVFAILVRFYIQSERSCCSFDQSQSHSSRLFPHFLKVLFFLALSTILIITTGTFASSSLLILPVFILFFFAYKTHNCDLNHWNLYSTCFFQIWNFAPDINLVRMELRAQILMRDSTPVPAKTATLDKTVTEVSYFSG